MSRSDSQTVLVGGATGYIGRVVAEHLVDRGHRVVAVVRPGSQRGGLPPGVEARAGDLTDPATLGSLVTPDVDAVVNLATPSGSLEVDAAATAALLGPLRGTGRAYVCTSGVWVLGPTGGRLADENTATNAIDLVGYRPQIERQVLDAAAHGVRSLVIRPGVAHGRGGGIPEMLVALAAEHGAGLHVGDGRVHWPMVHVDDLADLYVLAVERGAPGAVLHGVTERAVDTRALAASAAVAAGVPGVRPWPLREARRALGEGFANALACDQSVAAQLTRRTLGWEPTGPTALADVARGSYGVADAA